MGLKYMSIILVHFVAVKKNEEKFDSSRDRDEKFSFTLGDGQVIKAWDIGVATMKKNEICELICKPEYAYGNKATGSIPANSTLKFEIELFEWKGQDISPGKDGSIIQTILAPGTGFESPQDCMPVKISITGKYDGVEFDKRDVSMEIGDCVSSNLITGIEIAVKKMKKGERSRFDIESKHAFGNMGNAAMNIPPYATVTYEIHLKEFDKIKESYSLDTADEKLKYAEDFKTRATSRFQTGNLVYAVKLYEKSASYIEYDSEFTEEEKSKRNGLMLSLKLNLALCYLKMADPAGVITECDKALEIDPKNEKGLYRKGQALMLKSEFEEAKVQFQQLLAENSENKQALIQIKNCDIKIRENRNKEKKLYQSMFSKVGKCDDGDTNNKHEQQQPLTTAEPSAAAASPL